MVLSENPGIQEGSGHFFKRCQHRMPAAREQILPAEAEHTASIESTAVPPNQVTKNLAHSQKVKTVPGAGSLAQGYSTLGKACSVSFLNPTVCLTLWDLTDGTVYKTLACQPLKL